MAAKQEKVLYLPQIFFFNQTKPKPHFSKSSRERACISGCCKHQKLCYAQFCNGVWVFRKIPILSLFLMEQGPNWKCIPTKQIKHKQHLIYLAFFFFWSFNPPFSSSSFVYFWARFPLAKLANTWAHYFSELLDCNYKKLQTLQTMILL